MNRDYPGQLLSVSRTAVAPTAVLIPRLIRIETCLDQRIRTRGTYLFALPGSPGACRDGWEMILKDQLDYRHRPCNFVELFPRLQEHEGPED